MINSMKLFLIFQILQWCRILSSQLSVAGTSRGMQTSEDDTVVNNTVSFDGVHEIGKAKTECRASTSASTPYKIALSPDPDTSSSIGYEHIQLQDLDSSGLYYKSMFLPSHHAK